MVRLVKMFRTGKDIIKVNAFLDNIQLTNDDNRVISVQIDGNFAYIIASVEVGVE